MKRLIAPLVLTLVVAAPAEAHTKKAKTYRGTFKVVGAERDYVTGGFGTAVLVDGRRNDTLSVHVRRLGRRNAFVFKLQRATAACRTGAPAGTDVAGWRYRRAGLLKTSRGGTANSWAKSRSFTAAAGAKYVVGVYAKTTGQLVLCAELRTKAAKKPRGHGKPQGHGNQGRGERQGRGNQGRNERQGRGNQGRGERRGHRGRGNTGRG